MAITPNINRQTRLVAYVDITYADLVSGSAVNAIHLPAGARVLGGFLDITTAWNSGTSDSLTVGDTVGSTPDVDRYKTATDAQATGLGALLGPLTNAVIPSGGAWVTVSITSVGDAATAGAARLQVEYVVDDRVTEYNPYRG